MITRIDAIPLALPARFTVATMSWRNGLRSRRRPPHDRFGNESVSTAPQCAPLLMHLAPITTSGVSAATACGGYGSRVLQLAGHWCARVAFEMSDDGDTWQPVALVALTSGTMAMETTAPGMWRTPHGFTGRFLRIRVCTLTAGAVTGVIAAVSLPPDACVDLPHAA